MEPWVPNRMCLKLHVLATVQDQERAHAAALQRLAAEHAAALRSCVSDAATALLAGA